MHALPLYHTVYNCTTNVLQTSFCMVSWFSCVCAADSRTTLVFHIPLAEVVTDYFDQLKSRSKGYASMEYKITGYRVNNLCLLEIKINGEPAPPLSVICHKDNAYRVGRQLCLKLKELIPRQMFRVPIQVRAVLLHVF